MSPPPRNNKSLVPSHYVVKWHSVVSGVLVKHTLFKRYQLAVYPNGSLFWVVEIIWRMRTKDLYVWVACVFDQVRFASSICIICLEYLKCTHHVPYFYNCTNVFFILIKAFPCILSQRGSKGFHQKFVIVRHLASKMWPFTLGWQTISVLKFSIPALPKF